ncbi:MAG: hypothetical protein AABX29_01580 [Nanoarchaeota archaeon]
MPNKVLEKVVDEESKKRLVDHFNRLVSGRDYNLAREFYRVQPELVKRAIDYDPGGWCKALRCSSL